MNNQTAGLVLAAGLSCSVQAVDQRPNIIFMMADDQTAYTMSCYGNQDAKIPHLDQLARDGLIFDRHYATTAICMASRATLMTGLFECKAGCHFLHGDLREST